MYSKGLVAIFVLCFIHTCLSKPTTNNEQTEGRGIGSTLWGWITYPFTWWSSSEPEQSPISDPLTGLSTYEPYEVTETDIGAKPNITVLCNDQTCTTTKCDRYGCRNVTCNIYDTDLTGVCREYNTIKPEEVPRTTELISQQNYEKAILTTTMVNIATSTLPSTQKDNNPGVDEHPLALEAVLSSTVSKDFDASKTITDATKQY